MSTASRNCGLDGGARAGKRNALSAPGVNGKLREHYDSRAPGGQLGGPPKGKRPKRMPESENAATGSRAQAPNSTPTPKLREPRLRQSPPPQHARPPPPGAARIFDFDVVERAEPLARCPDLVCVRGQRCRNAGTPRPCRRLFQSRDEFRMYIAEKLAALNAGRPKRVFASHDEQSRHMAKVHRALRGDD